MKKTTRVFLLGVTIFLLVAGISLFFVRNINVKNKKETMEGRYIIIGRNNVIAVFEDRLALKIPYEIEIEKDETLGEIVEKREYDRVLESVNRIIPENIEKYKIIKLGDVDLKVKNALNIPETRIDEKRYIVQSSVNSLFSEYYKKIEDVPFDKVKVEILNGNGINGYAKKVGNALKEKFNLNYTAATYSEIIGETEIIINNISQKKVDDIVMQLNEKHIKLRQVPAGPEAADIIIILGDDKKAETEIELVGSQERTKAVEEQLLKLEYKNIVKSKNSKNLSLIEVVESEIVGIQKNDEQKKEEPVAEVANEDKKEKIEYNREDYYTAYKLGRSLEIKDIVENNSLEKKIKVTLKETK